MFKYRGNNFCPRVVFILLLLLFHSRTRKSSLFCLVHSPRDRLKNLHEIHGPFRRNHVFWMIRRPLHEIPHTRLRVHYYRTFFALSCFSVWFRWWWTHCRSTWWWSQKHKSLRDLYVPRKLTDNRLFAMVCIFSRNILSFCMRWHSLRLHWNSTISFEYDREC